MEAQSRIVGELRRLAQEHEDQNVAVVTHADVIKAALAYFGGIHVDLIDRLEVPPCSVNVLEMDGDHARAMTFNL